MQKLEIENRYQEAYIRAKCFKGLFTHDISNLFHTIGNSFELCEMLLKEGVSKEDILAYFALIEEQINRGKKLVRNFRNLTELEEYEMPLEPIDLLENLENAVRFVQANFPKRNIDIKINTTANEIKVSANDLLLDVFENIFLNSIIYNKNLLVQIEVLISEIIESSIVYIKLEFKDNGIGIDDVKKYEILQEGYRNSKNSRSMGIGLSFVAKFIDLCEGRIWIEDRIKGDSSKGSNFIILIPKAAQNDLVFHAYRSNQK
ncbi:MAG: sensor histidine kinase [Promethearchaeota archaeon]